MSIIERARSFLVSRKQAYQRTLKGPLSEIILRDLATFCFAAARPHFQNDRDFFVAEGRRQVWERIQQHLQLSEQQLWNLYDGRADDV